MDHIFVLLLFHEVLFLLYHQIVGISLASGVIIEVALINQSIPFG